jgi:hypothetical protein
LTPAANATLNLGGTSNYWGTVYANAVASATTVSAVGNITGGNVLTSGLISATGNVYSGNLINSGASSVTGNVTGGNITTAGLVTATGNVTGGNILTAGLISATSTITSAANVVGGNITTVGLVTATGNVTGGNVLTGGIMSSTGNATHGNLSVSTGTVTLGNIVNANGNGVGNIGSSSLYFNTVFAKATSAQYADLAEKYVADAEYAPGTVVSFGGDNEVTVSTTDGDRRVAGVVSTNPSYIMNGALEAEHVATIALTGRVPTRVTGPVAKGDLMVSNGDGTARAESDPRAGAIIGKALENFEGGTGTIEVVVGRF